MEAQLSSPGEVLKVLVIAAALGIAGGLANALAEPIKRIRTQQTFREAPEDALATSAQNRSRIVDAIGATRAEGAADGVQRA